MLTRLQGTKRSAADLLQLVGQLPGITVDCGFLVGRNVLGEDVFEYSGDAGATVRVAEGDGKTFADHAAITQAPQDLLAHRGRDPAIVDGDEHEGLRRGGGDRESLGPKVLGDAFRFGLANEVAGEPDRVVRRDVDTADPDVVEAVGGGQWLSAGHDPGEHAKMQEAESECHD